MVIRTIIGNLVAVTLLAWPSRAQSSGRPGYGLIGYGITMYQPECAHACRSSLPRSSIPCDIHLHGHHSSSVSADCLAQSEAYLMSAAWCFHTRCPDENVPVSVLERFWEMDLVGRELDQPQPKWSYVQSLKRVMEDVPTEPLGEEEDFNRTVTVTDDDYIANWNGNTGFERVETNHQTYSLVIFLTGVAIPIALSFLRFVPFPPSLVSKFYAYFIEPPAFGRHHAQPVLGLGLVPTRGQALFIFYIIAINVILTGVGHNALRPNSWYVLGTYEEITNYVANRAGMLSFANLPLLFLYAGRNNILLWLTNWSHSTFLLLHRWIAIICMLQAVIHSALWLHIHVAWAQDHSEVAMIPYWYWGIIATLALVIIMPLSVLPIRKKMYEFFHATHIVFAILAVVGCWYHIIYRYKRQWGYENWVIMAAVIWAFDWVLRAARLVGRGVHRAYVTRVDDDYLRIDVPGVYCHGHAYAYFPTLSWRVWESHPFSVAGFAYKNRKSQSGRAVFSKGSMRFKNAASPGSSLDSVKQASVPTTFKDAQGVSFFVRVEKGTTSLLAAHHGSVKGVPILLENYSGDHGSLGYNLSLTEHSNTIFIAGGVGITNILPKIISGHTLYQGASSKKLYWGVRSGSDSLVNAVQSFLEDSGATEKKAAIKSEGLTSLRWGPVNVQVSVGERFDLRTLLASEIQSSKGGTTVIVCGPPAMADEVRMIVTSQGRHGSLVKLVEESFMW